MFPLRDENPTIRFPIATVVIISVTVLAWVGLQGAGTQGMLLQSLCYYGLIPGDLFALHPEGALMNLGGLACPLDRTTPAFTLITHMFMHGGWFHIIGNLWFLWVFGDNVEDAMGRGRFVAFYLLCGLGAAAAQIVTDYSSFIPMVGASGAIGGIMGAYARFYPRAHVHTLIFLGFYVTTVAVPAVFMLGYWFALQLLAGLPALAASGGGVAFWAHIGGFLTGIILAGPFSRADYLAAHRAQGERHASRHRLF